MKYLVALDGSGSSDKPFEAMLGLARKEDTILFATVIPKDDAKTRANAEQFLSKYVARAKKAGLSHSQPCILEGDARDVLCEAAQSQQIDIMFVGSRGLSGLKKLILGSVSSYVMQNACCDVLVAK